MKGMPPGRPPGLPPGRRPGWKVRCFLLLLVSASLAYCEDFDDDFEALGLGDLSDHEDSSYCPSSRNRGGRSAKGRRTEAAARLERESAAALAAARTLVTASGAGVVTDTRTGEIVHMAPTPCLLYTSPSPRDS